MSRLRMHQNKVLSMQIILLVLFVIGIFLFFLLGGFRLFIQATLLIPQLGGNEKNLEKSKDQFFGTLEVDQLPMGTNSARMIVSGTVRNFTTVSFILNGEKVKTISKKETFSEEIGDLQKGKNTIKLVATNTELKEEKSSETYLVILKTEKPKLEISEPSDKARLSTKELIVKGLTDPDVTVQVNNQPTVVNSTGQFQTQLILSEGETKLIVTAEDLYGNTEKKEIQVTYQKE